MSVMDIVGLVLFGVTVLFVVAFLVFLGLAIRDHRKEQGEK